MSRNQRRARGRRRDHTTAVRTLTASGGLALAATLLSGAGAEAVTTGPTIEVESLFDTSSPSASHVHSHQAPTLADAISYLNGTSTGGTITFASGLSGMISLKYTLPIITEPTVIRGLGVDNLTIKGMVSGSDPVLHFAAGNGQSKISGLVVTGGAAGGVYAVSPLILDNVTIRDNSTAGNGGGVFVDAAPLVIRDSTITNNSAVHNGGGLEFAGNKSLTIQRSTISGNAADSAGGVVAVGHGHTTIESSTISGNLAGTGGGLVLGYSSATTGPAAVIENSTIADNQATGFAGGIYLTNPGGGGGTMTLLGDTIAGNVSLGSTAGGIVAIGMATKLEDSILAGNTDNQTGSGHAPDVYLDSSHHTTMIARFSLIGDASDVGGGQLTTNSTDIRGTGAKPTNPKLGALGHHGGPTQTMLPRSGSPALQVGNARLFVHAVSGVTFKTDQRGRTRAGLSGSNTIPDGTDVGAVELTNPAQRRALVAGNHRFTLSTASPTLKLKAPRTLPVTLDTSTLAHHKPKVRFQRMVLRISGSRAKHRYKHMGTTVQLGLSGLRSGSHTLTAAITYSFRQHGHKQHRTKTLRVRIRIG